MRGPVEPYDDSALDAPDAMGLRLRAAGLLEGQRPKRVVTGTPPPVRRERAYLSPLADGSLRARPSGPWARADGLPLTSGLDTTPPPPPRVASVVPELLVLPVGSEPPVRGARASRWDDEGSEVDGVAETPADALEEWGTFPPATARGQAPERRNAVWAPVVVFGLLLGMAAIPPVVAVVAGVQHSRLKASEPVPTEPAPATVVEVPAEPAVMKPAVPAQGVDSARGADAPVIVPAPAPPEAADPPPTSTWAPWGTAPIDPQPAETWDAP